jgi:uncharacterized protein (TIGR03435 family)
MQAGIREAVPASVATQISGSTFRVLGQDQSARPSFEVASIKRTQPAERQRTGFLPTPGRFTAEDVPASALIGYAHRGQMDEMRGAPEWSTTDHYNVVAPLPPDTTPDHTAAMVRNLIVERFHFAGHFETEERDVYALVRTQPGCRSLRSAERGLSCVVWLAELRMLN